MGVAIPLGENYKGLKTQNTGSVSLKEFHVGLYQHIVRCIEGMQNKSYEIGINYTEYTMEGAKNMPNEYTSPDGRVKFVFPEIDPTYDPGASEMIRTLEDNFVSAQKGNGELVASCFSPAQVGLQFKCGHCLKKAVAYGDKASLEYKFKLDWCRKLVLDWVRIKDAKKIIITTFCAGKVVDHEVASELKVNGEFHCNGETGIIELDPDSPETAGLSKEVYEIDCGAACKKVSNIDFVFDGGQLLSLFPPTGQSLIVSSFANGKLFNKQCVSQVIVEKEKVVSTEKSAVQIPK